MTKLLERVFCFLASLKLAVILLVGFAILLGVATFYESSTSTEAAQRLIYQSAWFDFLIFFLGVNVLCAALSRLPWKKRHFGFVITHLGIIIILIGSLVTRKFGVEGQLALLEGEAADSILVDESVFAVTISRLNVRKEFDPWFLKKGIPAGSEIRYSIGDTGIDCFIEACYINPRMVEQVSGQGTESNPAILVGLHQPGQTKPASEEWLLADEPGRNQLDLGMAAIEFKRVQTVEERQAALAPPIQTPPGPEGQILLKDKEGQTVQRVNVQEIVQRPFSFEWNGKIWELKFGEFLARAAVDRGKLIEREMGDLNPVIRFSVSSPMESEEHMAFSQFPELGSMHGRESGGSGLIAQFIYPADRYDAGGNRTAIILDMEGKLHYRASNVSGQWASGTVEIQVPFQTTWPSVQLSVQQFYPMAVRTEHVVDGGSRLDGGHNSPLLQLRLESNGQTASQYVSYNRPAAIALGNETVTVEFGQKRYPLGFSLQLIDFQAPRYPGTNRPARFQSVVKLIDPANQIEEERLIYMNNPLAYNRFLVYQSGYDEGRNGRPDTSIFSVAWAPGTSTIYVGSIVLCLGMVLMFVRSRMPAASSGNKA